MLHHNGFDTAMRARWSNERTFWNSRACVHGRVAEWFDIADLHWLAREVRNAYN